MARPKKRGSEQARRARDATAKRKKQTKAKKREDQRHLAQEQASKKEAERERLAEIKRVQQKVHSQFDLNWTPLDRNFERPTGEVFQHGGHNFKFGDETLKSELENRFQTFSSRRLFVEILGKFVPVLEVSATKEKVLYGQSGGRWHVTKVEKIN